MNKLAYKPKVCLIGSRDQLCVNSKINESKGFQLGALCRQARSGKKGSCCEYFEGVGDEVVPRGFPWDRALDIENLHKLGLKKKVCPFYLQRNRVESADLVLMPYNYLFDDKTRRTMKINFQDSIIIMDEAHNIDRVAADVASFELNIGILNMALAELSKLKNLIDTTQDKKQYVSHSKHIVEIITMTKNI